MLDHKYIDDNSLAERYLRHALTPKERRDFEEHLVDCQECADRLMLAEMFLVRNGSGGAAHPAPIVSGQPAVETAKERPPGEPLPLRARIAARLTPWQIFILFAITALILLSIPAAGVLIANRLHR